MSRHLGLLWVAVEGTTLATAPLIHYRRDSRSLEATWKYLVLCSVGIAVALLGNFFVAAAGTGESHLMLDSLARNAKSLNPTGSRPPSSSCRRLRHEDGPRADAHLAADAHSEAPAPVSALLSGALLNCAFLALLRVHAVLVAADLGDFSRSIFLLFGCCRSAWRRSSSWARRLQTAAGLLQRREHGHPRHGRRRGRGLRRSLPALNHSLAREVCFCSPARS